VRVSRFEDLVVWKGARDLAAHVYRITAAGEFARDFGMRNQIRRARRHATSKIRRTMIAARIAVAPAPHWRRAHFSA